MAAAGKALRRAARDPEGPFAPTPARGHMPFEGHRSCAQWVDRTAARETLRGASSEQRPNKCDRRTGHGERFAGQRLKGEWFTFTDELENLIKEAANAPQAAPKVVTEPPARMTDEEFSRQHDEKCREILAEGMRIFAALGPSKNTPIPDRQRNYVPVASAGGQFNDTYAVREVATHKRLCDDLKLTFDQADRLCEVFEGVRERALDLPRQREQAA